MNTSRHRRFLRTSLIDTVVWFFLDAVFATDLDRKYPRDEEGKDGTAIVTTLAAFVTLQGGFVAASIRDAKSGPKLWALFTIYIVLFALSFVGLELVLRLTKGRNGTTVRVFDRVTIIYTRWVLSSGLIVLVLLSWLAYHNLLPGQPTRYDFDDKLTTTALFGSGYPRGASAESSLKERTRGMMDNWIKTLATQYSRAGVLVILEQNQSFRLDYFPFLADVTVRSPYTIGDRFAFLVSEDPPPPQLTGLFGDYYLPEYRQVPFEPSTGDGRMPSQRLRVPAPNRGEKLVRLP